MIYSWIWKKLPGPKWLKIIESALLIATTLAIFWFLVFPNVQSYFSGDPAFSEN